MAAGKVTQKNSWMPIFFQQDIDVNTRVAIWKIEEEESFFLQHVMPQRNVSHPHKKLQHLAGRYLLKHLFSDFPLALIQIADTKKPYLEDEAFHFSISHCSDFAAAIVSRTRRVGVDVELTTDKVEKIKHKFLTEAELNISSVAVAGAMDKRQSSDGVEIPKLTLLWSCKEAVYKWFGSGEVDFKEHIVVESLTGVGIDLFRTSICFKKKEPIELSLSSTYFTLTPSASNIDAADEQRLVLSYVVT